MSNYYFVKTEDGSSGLYSETDNDILHSKTGAKKEAFDKFINPLNEELLKKENISILDICSGCGYNLKAAVSKLKNKTAKIDCIDINTEYILLSAFLEDMFDDAEMKLLILSEILKSGFSVARIYSLILDLKEKGFNEFLNPAMTFLIEFLFTRGYISDGLALNRSFLHNIYYSYISHSNKYAMKDSNYKDVKIDYHILDARKMLLNSKSIYDIVFLDGFSPQKNPTLWTIDFLNLLKEHMSYNSILTSYSKSTPFRSALLNLNFYVGKTFINDIDMGTVASLNEENIMFPLNEYDIELFKTTGGIYYRDSKFSLHPEDIISNRIIEQKMSNRQSLTSFLKHHKNFD